MSLTKTGLHHSLYEKKTENPVDTFDPSSEVNIVYRNKFLEYGKSVLVRKHRDLFAYEGLANDASCIALVLTSKGPSSFDWEYDSRTLKALRLIGEHTDTRIEYTCKLLGELGDINSLPVLNKLLTHPKHNVRWAAVQSIMLIDFDAGLKALEFCKNDPHIEIREAVEQSLIDIEDFD